MRMLDDNDLTEMGVRPRSRAQRWRLIRSGKFPRPVKLGSRNAWPEYEITAWLKGRIAERDGTLLLGSRQSGKSATCALIALDVAERDGTLPPPLA